MIVKQLVTSCSKTVNIINVSISLQRYNTPAKSECQSSWEAAQIKSSSKRDKMGEGGGIVFYL